jgi:hypothetical protein
MRYLVRLFPAFCALPLACWLAAPQPVRAAGKERARNSLPSFSVVGGVFTNELSLTLSSPAKEALVRYTVDGSTPGENSPVAARAILLTNCTVVQARLFAPGEPPGPVAAETFLFLEPDLFDFESNIPLVLVHTSGRELVKEDKLTAAFRVLDTRSGRVTLLTPPDYAGLGLISLRGRASLRYAKRSYTWKTVDAQEDPIKTTLLGMPKESDWVLYAPFPDKTLMRDALAYDLSNQVGRWAPRTRFVELFLNETGGRLGRRDYLGVYVLEERVKRDRNRVDLQELGLEDNAEPEVTGGYVFKKDHSDRGEQGPMIPGAYPAFTPMNSSKTGFPTDAGGFPGDPAGFQPPFRGTSRSSSSSSTSSSKPRSRSGVVTNHVGAPTRREMASVTRTIISRGDDEDMIEMLEEERFRESFRTVKSNKFYYVHPEPDELTSVQRGWLQQYVNRLETALYGPDFKDPAKGYRAYLDVDSFVDYHLLVEVTKNVDGFRFSTFYHKERGGKLKMGPLWDWNLSFGNCNGKQGYMPEWWLWPQLDDKEYSWFRRLFEDPEFSQRYVDRWTELRRTAFATTNVLARIDEWATMLESAQTRNFQRWPILGLAVNPNYYVGETYAEELKWMKDWITARLTWIENQFVPAPDLVSTAGQMQLKSARGKVYYTMDGQDPRSIGGTLAASAKLYEQPLGTPSKQTLFARTLDGTRWSGPLVRRLP